MYNLEKLIGEQLRLIRKAKKMSQEEVAEKAGMSAPRISEIENGKQNTTIGTLGKIMNALTITPSELFNFKNIDIDASYENKEMIAEVYKSLLMERGVDEVKTIVSQTKSLLYTMDKLNKSK